MEKYSDRYAAGKILAKELKSYSNRSDVIIIALPRGGVPGYEELALGALAMDGSVVFNEESIKNLALSQQDINVVIAEESRELQRREKLYRGQKPFPILKEKTVIVVDDGMATGSTILVAIKSLHELKPKKIIVAVPVAEITTCKKIELLVNQLVCPFKVEHFYAVGQYYDDFPQIRDEEVLSLLQKINNF